MGKGRRGRERGEGEKEERGRRERGEVRGGGTRIRIEREKTGKKGGKKGEWKGELEKWKGREWRRGGRKGKRQSTFPYLRVCMHTLMLLHIRRQSCTIHDAHVRTSTTQYAPGKFFSEQKELVAV